MIENLVVNGLNTEKRMTYLKRYLKLLTLPCIMLKNYQTCFKNFRGIYPKILKLCLTKRERIKLCYSFHEKYY